MYQFPLLLLTREEQTKSLINVTLSDEISDIVSYQMLPTFDSVCLPVLICVHQTYNWQNFIMQIESMCNTCLEHRAIKMV